MQYHDFIERVRERAELESEDQARKASEATLKTLTERLYGGESVDLLSQLPQPIKLSVMPYTEADYTKYDLDHFVAMIAEREAATYEDALVHAKAVFDTLEEAVSPGEMDDVRGQLPKEFHYLIEGAGTHKPPH